ncbi:creatininase family protein [Dactylosporangium sucinum]|uniref:Creatinine amidohydrolase n=1 Tax=Dactylosporangium sucinum TaxID=1424081 RepID=A0A917U809_9ACTN|nr:creatininase family protein [Dactylosporangium sucinum]GGM61866.1 creatinine amidohydrolase [Dactylosporangium sucinum]
MPSVLFAEYDRESLRRIGDSGAVLVLPIGAIEQHGPHLPVWTDSLVVERLATAAAQSLAGTVPVLVAPTMPFGSSAHHLPFGGTLSLDTTVLYEVLLCLGRSAHGAGFRRVFLLNGHGGNHELVELAARDLSLRLDIDVAAASWWRLAWAGLAETDVFAHGRVPGHAGAFESALVGALRPDLVRPFPAARPGPHRSDPVHAVAPIRVERAGFWQDIDGYTDQPGAIPPEAGAEILAIATAAVAGALADFYRTDE